MRKRLDTDKTLIVMDRVMSVTDSVQRVSELLSCSLRTAHNYARLYREQTPFQMRRLYANNAADALGIPIRELSDGRDLRLRNIFRDPPAELSDHGARKHVADIALNLTNMLFNNGRPTADCYIRNGIGGRPARLLIETTKKEKDGKADRTVLLQFDFSETAPTLIRMLLCAKRAPVYCCQLSAYEIAVLMNTITNPKITIA
jgi:hypothetical protein